MVVNCPVCGKLTAIFWPQHWVYKRGKTYYCSWNCLQVDQTRDMNLLKTVAERRSVKKVAAKKILTDEAKEKAIQIALRGEDPKPFLRSLGLKDPTSAWRDIRSELKDHDPDTYYRLPKMKTGPRKQKTEHPAEEKTAQVEEPAAEDLRKSFVPNEFSTDIVATEKQLSVREKLITTAVKHPELGEFYFDRKYNSIDWRTADGDEVSMAPAFWIQMIDELPEIMKVLGVNE